MQVRRSVASGVFVTKLDNWGYQWLTFHDFAPQVESEFADIMQPFHPQEFEGKLVLDAGCGNGRFARACAAQGPRLVVGFDLSQSVIAANANTADLPNVTILQGSISDPPFPLACFDHVFCIGVIHHLPEPRAGFLALTKLLKPGAKISIWVYAQEGNELIVRFFEPLRKRVTSRLPWGVTKILSAISAAALWLLVTLLYRPARALCPTFFRLLPMHEYLWYIYSLGFRTLYHTAFDKLSPQLCSFVSYAQLEEWFSAAGLQDVVISHRNGNSWRAQGRRPGDGGQ
jgi:SAM-dependent methyltransferase